MKYKIILLVIAALMVVGCDQYASRNLGGKTTITLEKGQRLLEATWKEDGNIWYLTEPADSDYVPKVKVFQESSMYGVLEGKVIFIEQ